MRSGGYDCLANIDLVLGDSSCTIEVLLTVCQRLPLQLLPHLLRSVDPHRSLIRDEVVRCLLDKLVHTAVVQFCNLLKYLILILTYSNGNELRRCQG